MGWFANRKKKNTAEEKQLEEKQPEKTEIKIEKTAETEKKTEKKTASVSKKKTTTTSKPKVSNAKKIEKKEITKQKKEKPKTSPKQKSEPVQKATGKKPIYRVLYDKESRFWLIKKDGAKRTIASYITKEEALNRVKELSSSNEMSFVVHKKDGKFQKK